MVPMQADALDVVLVREGKERDGDASELESWHCFGTPVLAPVTGQVAKVHRGEKDMAIGVLGADGGHPAGNHVVLTHGDVYVLLAHLKADSLLIDKGDLVQAGDAVAQCGNSGNTSQPHLHIQAQTHVDLFNAENRTFPLAFEGVRVRGGQETVGPVALRRNDVLRPP
jgi:murein DD-endopeptidase MepM/ murein hydrolase activator NlpD